MVYTINKALAFFAGIVALVAVIPMDFFAWWKTDVLQPWFGTDYKWSNYINAFGQFFNKIWHGDDLVATDLGSTLLMSGVFTIIGGILMIVAAVKKNKGVVVLGAIITILAPITFLVGINGLNMVNDLLVGTSGNAYFGSGSVYSYTGYFNVEYGTGSWYLGVGFFLPFGASVLGFLSARSNK